MQPEFQNFLKEVSSVTKKYYGDRLDKIVLYGSYARGEQHEESDVDLMIVLKDERVSASTEIFSFGNEVYGIGRNHGHLISILPTSIEKYSHSQMPVYYYARLEGIVIE